ncbi:hypothetical protein FHT98_5084 [Bosea sp. AK1]|uniref:hypothetical protein n=1 Tax=Bosea sp. AK1 TaxID=2587160 RepID=UPI00114D6F4C|nr:hypothetical protein [Bosea sp. AK1]TQI65217.1 hypothetical protein FHT98_5084 [Bosea sp. AK1]
MPKTSPQTIESLFDVPTRFMRSVQLERDFDDPQALENYIVTPAMAAAFQRVASGAATSSRLRAWRLTGDYGVGKSSFAVVLAHLLATPTSSVASAIAERMGWSPNEDHRRLWPLLVTGARENLTAAMARGIEEGLERRRPRRPGKIWAQLAQEAQALRRRPDPDALVDLLERVRTLAEADGEGVLLIVDELGKLLEYAAAEPGRDDVYLLQSLAQAAARSGERPFFLIGLLHQGFQAYAERLPSVVRHEWDKVAGRFEEIVFDQPMAHTAALVAGALGVHTERLPDAVQVAARQTASATAAMGWMSGATSAAMTMETAQLYPLHPTLLPPLVRFFSRYGQHERSLFGFLLSSEPYGLQAFADRPVGRDVWYGLPEFYDYVRAIFGHRLSGNSYQSSWMRIAATVDTAQDLNATETRVLKTAALLSLLDYPELLATDAALRACLTPTNRGEVDAAIVTLVDRGLLFRRGKTTGYRLWPNSSVNLYAAIETARRNLGELETVSPHLANFVAHEPILARRHYIERGTMRHFEVRYAPVHHLEQMISRPSQADGLVIIALADTAADRTAAFDIAKGPVAVQRDDVIIGVTQPLGALAGEISDLKCWQWVADHTPELANDAYASAEVARQLAARRRALEISLGVTAALRERGASTVSWRWLGKPVETPDGLSSLVSSLCDSLYADAPRIANELLNRKVLSSPAAAARMRLIEGLFTAPEKPYFGIDPTKAPPEKSMFLSVIEVGKLQKQTLGGHFSLTLPEAGSDALNLRPALNVVEAMLEAAQGEKVGVGEILNRLSARPFGVRAGVAPLLLAVVLKMRAHEVAVYENGTFRSTFTGQDFIRLIKGPDTFALQSCRIEGVRADVFAKLARAFAQPAMARESQILDVVQPLARFAARLPEYTRKAGELSPRTARVREVLLSATEPVGLLFRDLPVACGLEPFAANHPPDELRATTFVQRLEAAISEMRADYPKLLQRITETIAASIGGTEGLLDRAALAQRAARVATAATLPKLKTFALRLRDPNTTNEAWAEAIGSYLVAKPPARWNGADERRALEEMTSLSQLFHRVETAAFENGALKGENAVLIKLTQATGDGRGLVVQNVKLSRASEQLAREIGEQLQGQPRAERLHILSRLLWDDLPAEDVGESTPDDGSAAATGGRRA